MDHKANLIDCLEHKHKELIDDMNIIESYDMKAYKNQVITGEIHYNQVEALSHMRKAADLLYKSLSTLHGFKES